MSTCPTCGATVAAADRFCEACGATLAAAAEVRVEPSAEVPADPSAEVPAEPGAEVPAEPGAGTPCAGCGADADQRDADGYCTNCGMRAARPRDHQEFGDRDVAAVSDRGVRHHRNEDAVDLRVTGTAVVVVVADGVSSSTDPDAASAVAVRVAADEIAAGLAAGSASVDDVISRAVVHARGAVADLAEAEARAAGAPACTIVLAAAVAGEVHLSWLGDSRAYWVPVAGPATALTLDDSGAAEAIEAGIEPAVAYRMPQAHAITAWLGVDAPPVPPHLARLPQELLAGGGTLVVCSDGLWNYLEVDADFSDRVRTEASAGDGSALDLARRLTDFAIIAGGSDNITVAIVPAAAIANTRVAA